MSEWMPIESAPKDETAVILYMPAVGYRGAVITSAYWTTHNVECWHVDDQKNGPYPLRGTSPAHWMPLPEPPK